MTALMTLCVLACLCLPGCGYGEVSPLTYDYAKALYSICNRREEQGLEKLTQMVDASRDAGEISAREASWLEDIIEQARQGDWQEGMAAARRMMTDQIDR